MPRIVRCGLIQASNVKSPAEASLPEIREAMGVRARTERGRPGWHSAIRRLMLVLPPLV